MKMYKMTTDLYTNAKCHASAYWRKMRELCGCDVFNVPATCKVLLLKLALERRLQVTEVLSPFERTWPSRFPDVIRSTYMGDEILDPEGRCKDVECLVAEMFDYRMNNARNYSTSCQS